MLNWMKMVTAIKKPTPEILSSVLLLTNFFVRLIVLHNFTKSNNLLLLHSLSESMDSLLLSFKYGIQGSFNNKKAISPESDYPSVKA